MEFQIKKRSVECCYCLYIFKCFFHNFNKETQIHVYIFFSFFTFQARYVKKYICHGVDFTWIYFICVFHQKLLLSFYECCLPIWFLNQNSFQKPIMIIYFLSMYVTFFQTKRNKRTPDKWPITKYLEKYNVINIIPYIRCIVIVDTHRS